MSKPENGTAWTFDNRLVNAKDGRNLYVIHVDHVPEFPDIGVRGWALLQDAFRLSLNPLILSERPLESLLQVLHWYVCFIILFLQVPEWLEAALLPCQCILARVWACIAAAQHEVVLSVVHVVTLKCRYT